MPKDQNAKSLPKVFNPSGWEDHQEAWPFAAEVSFWTLPPCELEAALEWELRRERNRHGLIDDFNQQWDERVAQGKKLRMQIYGPEPWLTLPNDIRSHYADSFSRFKRPPAVEIATTYETNSTFSSFGGSLAIHRGYCASDDEFRKLPLLGHEGCLVALKLDLAQGRKAIREGFAEIMKELDLPSKTGNQTDAKKNLRALAVFRAKNFSKSDPNWMRIFPKDTPYSGHTSAQKQRIKEAKRLLGPTNVHVIRSFVGL